MFLKQISVGNMDNFCYLVGSLKECVIIDPGFDASKILNSLEGHKVVKILLTHIHYDHDGEAKTISSKTSAKIYSGNDFKDKEEFKVGSLSIKVHHTPGHSPESVVYEVENKLFTGDTLFVEGCGRTDFPGGDPVVMKKTLDKLKEFPDDYEVYPGHDYGSKKISTIGYEKKNNSCLV